MTSNVPNPVGEPEPRIVYVERPTSSWSWFTPFRTFMLIVVLALLIFVSVSIYNGNKKLDTARQNVEQSQLGMERAQQDMRDAMLGQ